LTLQFVLNFARLSKESNQEFFSVEESIKVLDSIFTSTGSRTTLPGGIYPLLYRNTIQANLKDRISPITLSHLKNATYRSIADDIVQKKWLKKIVDILQNNAISAIILKGSAFADTLYPQDAPRLGVDIDFLVKENEFERVCNLLNNIIDPVILDDTRMATYSTLFERVFSAKGNGGPIVEVHRALTNPHLFTIAEEDLWKGSTQHPAFQSDYIRILSPEDTLLHLAVHAFRDLDFCTHNLLDAHEVWCQWKPDSATLFLHAKRWNARKVLYYLLVNCKTIMQTPVPETLLAKLKPGSFTDSINRKVLQSALSATPTNNSTAFRVWQLISQITFVDRFWYGLQHQIVYGVTRLMDFILSLRKR